jgi:hypothetical protein
MTTQPMWVKDDVKAQSLDGKILDHQGRLWRLKVLRVHPDTGEIRPGYIMVQANRVPADELVDVVCQIIKSL